MALLEEAARQLYQEWFVRLRFPGHEHARITNGVPEAGASAGSENRYCVSGGTRFDNCYRLIGMAAKLPGHIHRSNAQEAHRHA